MRARALVLCAVAIAHCAARSLSDGSSGFSDGPALPTHFGCRSVHLFSAQSTQLQPRSHWLVPAAPRERRRYKISADAPISQALLYTNGAIFVLLLGQPRLFDALAKNDALIRQGQLHRMVSSCFLHGGVLHLAFNLQSLRALGTPVERWFGSKRFAATYILSGVAGNALSLAVGRSPLSVGASGAIFGLLGAWYVFLERNQEFFCSRGVDVSATLGGMVQMCALNAMLGLSPGSRIDNVCHLGGLLGGGACSYAFGPRLRYVRVGVTKRIVDQPLLKLPLLDEAVAR